MSMDNFSDQTGYLGNNPESRNVNDTSVVTFDLATTKRWKDKQTGEARERTFWRRYEAWGKMGENIMRMLKKGSRVRVISEPENDDYEKGEGANKITVYVERHKVLNFRILDKLDSKGEEGYSGNGDDEEAAF